MIDKTTSIIKKYLDKGRNNERTVTELHNTITRIDNTYISSNSVLLEEALIGDIYSLQEVIVAEGASVSGNITSKNSTIRGKVVGDIISTDYVDIKSTAEINGSIRTESVQIEPGSLINGHIHIEEGIDDSNLIIMVKKGISNHSLISKEAIVSHHSPKASIQDGLKKEIPKMKNQLPSPKEKNESVSDSWY
jgi:cytoskeletal protein CcmA (bactofilin family)